MASPLSRDEYTDAAWIKDAMFMSARGSLKGNTSLRGAKFSDAALNFADTSPGGNPAINPPPQWNHVCDPPVDSLLVATSDEVKNLGTMSLGMGTHYAEAIQPYTRKIYLQMGVKAFNSMGNFFTMFYDSGQGVLANTGEDRGILAKFGKIAGYITLWAAVPYLAAGKMLYDVAFKALASARNRPLSKFYYMKPTMTLYWTAVSTMYNAIAVNMGYGPETIMIDKGAEERPAFKAMERGDIEAYRKLLPDVMGGAEGGIDVKAVATRYQRLANKHASIFKKFADDSGTEAELKLKISAYLALTHRVPPANSIVSYVNEYASSPGGTNQYLNDPLSADLPVSTKADQTEVNAAVTDMTETTDKKTGLFTGLSKFFTKFGEFSKAELNDGSSYVCFNVEYEPTVSESFSNTSKTSDIAQMMNEKSAEARNKIFNLSGGNISDGAIGQVVGGIAKAATQLVGGLLESVNLQGLSALGGRAFVDIPEFWDTSSTTWPTSTYTIKLRTPYGTPFCYLTRIILPLSMIICTGAPMSTGKNSYTGPFLIKLWDEGRTKITLGLVDSISITRGVGNYGWSAHGLPNGVDVAFSVKNLSTITHIPISDGVSISDLVGVSMFDEDNNYTDYMAILSNLSLADQVYTGRKWALRRAKAVSKIDNWLTVSTFASWTFENTPASILRVIANERSF